VNQIILKEELQYVLEDYNLDQAKIVAEELSKSSDGKKKEY